MGRSFLISKNLIIQSKLINNYQSELIIYSIKKADIRIGY